MLQLQTLGRHSSHWSGGRAREGYSLVPKSTHHFPLHPIDQNLDVSSLQGMIENVTFF